MLCAQLDLRVFKWHSSIYGQQILPYSINRLLNFQIRFSWAVILFVLGLYSYRYMIFNTFFYQHSGNSHPAHAWILTEQKINQLFEHVILIQSIGYCGNQLFFSTTVLIGSNKLTDIILCSLLWKVKCMKPHSTISLLYFHLTIVVLW